MSMNNDGSTSGRAWTMIVLSIPLLVLAGSLLTDASVWWQFATAAVAGLVAIALIVAGIRGLVDSVRTRRADRAEAEARAHH